MEGDASSSHDSFTGGQPLDEYIKQTMITVRGCQKACAELQGWHHYRDYEGVQRTMERVNSTITSLVRDIFEHQDVVVSLSRHKISDQMDIIREGNDALLERINSDIDEASGLKKNANAELLDPVIKKITGPASLQVRGQNVVLLASRNVQKPQLFFSEKVQNSRKEPFIPILKEKPNSIKPLSILLCLDSFSREHYSHPYEYELQHWTTPASQLTPVAPQPPKPLDTTPLTMITTEQELADMVAKLKTCTEFAVDLEHHSFRSYLGLTCLIQISTREEDFIVDPLALRGKLTILNEVFTDNKITKVLHGSDYDVLWLQRDCGVYVVNLFDTHQAATVLEYPRRSLAALLSCFCEVQANKVFQRADWRIRPLNPEFIDYARQDSHYLLYIYDLMRNELIEKGNQLNNLITAVYQRSVDLCLKRYEKPWVGPESHMNLYRHSRKKFNSRQMFALRELFLWRDKVAREQDESPEYVLPKHMLLQIAEVLPKEMQGILACCNPIPPLVKTELLTLHTIMREAREQPMIDIKGTPVVKQMPVQASEPADDLSHNTYCKHDLSQCEENPSDLPTLLTPRETLLGNLFSEPEISITFKKKSDMFGELKASEAQLCTQKLCPISIAKVESTMQFMSPYERYSAYLDMKPLLEGGKRKREADTDDLERVGRVRDHFLCLSKNTTYTPEEIGRVASNHLKETEAQVRVDGLVIDHAEEEEEEDKEDEVEAEKQSSEAVKEERAADDEEARKQEQQQGGKEGKVKKKKRHAQKPMVVGEQIKGKKGKNKTLKRKSCEDGQTAHKVQKTDADLVDLDAGEGEEQSGEVAESSEHAEDCAGQEEVNEAFDYEAADYSLFQKAKNKGMKMQKVKEKFKGKNHKTKKGKSSMKSFTWGAHKGKW
ncbi:Exosome component 10 [Chionoecetes opilio]|uniref:Exosome complex component 10 homolog n=1 Tax=Chionoecetes opilio TaxID=41210 RepID=A0A8J4XQ54_CHIOP|nr:Exosome component 10 [Chionoecetes opilio]